MYGISGLPQVLLEQVNAIFQNALCCNGSHCVDRYVQEAMVRLRSATAIATLFCHVLLNRARVEVT